MACATIICHYDELNLSLTFLDCLQIDSEDFILFAENNQILVKIYFIPILLTFMYLVALYQTTAYRGAVCQFPFRCSYYYGSNKSTGKESEKTQLCELSCKQSQIKLELDSSL